ncbi:hypothetical protein FB45DRAFT_1065427, partial [Roridomyces roridus]
MDSTIGDPNFGYLWRSTMTFIVEMGVSLLLYGLYISLFVLGIYILSRRKGREMRFLVAASCLMFLLATMQMVFSVAMILVAEHSVREFMQGQISSAENAIAQPALRRAQNILFAFNNLITDSFFMYRCYVIWASANRFRLLLILPALLITATFAIGVAQNSATADPFALGAASNLVLTALTAGRIYWIRHVTSRFGPNKGLQSRLDTAIKLVLESGALYSATTIFLAIMAFKKASEPYLIGLTVSQQLMNIIPTFTIVYVGVTKAPVDQPILPKASIAKPPLGDAHGTLLHPGQVKQTMNMCPSSSRRKFLLYYCVALNGKIAST